MTLESVFEAGRALPVRERKHLIRLLVDSLPEEGADSETAKPYSILEFEGVGAEMWQSTSVKKYLDQLRDEWDSR